MSIADKRLSKNERLRSFGVIRRLFQDGRGGFIYPFRYMVYAEADEEFSASVLFSTPKKFHKRANKRNLLRRRMREAYRHNKELLSEAGKGAIADIAIIYSSKEVHDYKTIENALKRVLQNIAQSL
ncbi:MAG: ribonuclease P protein component [Alistipes sp.]|nr:ribonuclease P protein component [Alistipes sp.]